MIPHFTSTGLLPVGIHWSDRREVESRFGTNSHRKRLLNGLFRALDALEAAGCQLVYLDGSFVTAKPAPSDYDACWEVTGVRPRELDPVFLDFSNLRAAQKAKYLGEFFPAQAQAASMVTYIDFFQVDKASGDPKGIIGLRLNTKP